MSIFQISTNPEYYGSDATQDDADRMAAIIIEHARQEFPDVTFTTGDGNNSESDPDGNIQQTINDLWTDWV